MVPSCRALPHFHERTLRVLYSGIHVASRYASKNMIHAASIFTCSYNMYTVDTSKENTVVALAVVLYVFMLSNSLMRFVTLHVSLVCLLYFRVSLIVLFALISFSLVLSLILLFRSWCFLSYLSRILSSHSLLMSLVLLLYLMFSL